MRKRIINCKASPDCSPVKTLCGELSCICNSELVIYYWKPGHKFKMTKDTLQNFMRLEYTQ